jgi:hypothetical protein
MFDRKKWNFVQLFCRFWLCGHEWMLCILHGMFVAGHAMCQSPIGSYRLFFIGWEYVDTWHIDTWHILIWRSTFTELWSDGPPICEIWKKITNSAGICWHVACWHVADFVRTVHIYRAGTCHVEMINCEKVRLPRQICIFCVSAVSRRNPGFLFLESAFFFICLSRPQDCSDCDLELQTAVRLVSTFNLR